MRCVRASYVVTVTVNHYHTQHVVLQQFLSYAVAFIAAAVWGGQQGGQICIGGKNSG